MTSSAMLSAMLKSILMCRFSRLQSTWQCRRIPFKDGSKLTVESFATERLLQLAIWPMPKKNLPAFAMRTAIFRTHWQS